jgi:hypothetical protein
MRLLDLFRTGRPYYQEDSLYLTYVVLFLLECGAISALFLTPVACAPLDNLAVRLDNTLSESSMAFVNSHCRSILIGTWMSLVYFSLSFLVALGLFLGSTSDFVSLLEEQVGEYRQLVASAQNRFKFSLFGRAVDNEPMTDDPALRRARLRARAIEGAILHSVWHSILIKCMALTAFLAASVGYLVWLNVLAGDAGRSLGGARTGGVFLCDGSGRSGYEWSTVTVPDVDK